MKPLFQTQLAKRTIQKLFLTEFTKFQMPVSKTKLFQQVLESYLEADSRVDDLLCILSSLLSCTRSTSSQVKSKIDRKVIYQSIKKQRNPFKALKIITLIHKCINSRNIPDAANLLNKFMQVKIQNKQQSLFLQENVISKYSSFLQKKLFLENLKIQENQVQLGHLEQCYREINILKKGMSFTKSLMPLFRYYGPTKGYLIDLNIILAQEFTEMYKKLSVCFKKINEDDSQYPQLLHEIQVLHQDLYLIYYNCYNVDHVCNLRPKWINTSKKFQKLNIIQEQQRRSSKKLLRSSSLIVQEQKLAIRSPLKKRNSLRINSSMLTMDRSMSSIVCEQPSPTIKYFIQEQKAEFSFFEDLQDKTEEILIERINILNEMSYVVQNIVSLEDQIID